MKKLLLALLLIGIGLAGLAYWFKSPRQVPMSEQTFSYALVQRGKLTEVISATGLVEPREVVMVFSQLPGLVTEALAKANDVVVEGHTDRRPYVNGDRYGNWELSADRANAARRAMEQSGLGKGQVRTVRGFADTELHLKNDPLDPRNRRVSSVLSKAIWCRPSWTSLLPPRSWRMRRAWRTYQSFLCSCNCTSSSSVFFARSKAASGLGLP